LERLRQLADPNRVDEKVLDRYTIEGCAASSALTLLITHWQQSMDREMEAFIDGARDLFVRR
jgi:hypothetical protein